MPCNFFIVIFLGRGGGLKLGLYVFHHNNNFNLINIYSAKTFTIEYKKNDGSIYDVNKTIISFQIHFLFFKSNSSDLTLEACTCLCACCCIARENQALVIYPVVCYPRSLGMGGGELGSNWPPPLDFFGLNFCSLTDCQKLLHNCSLFVNKSFDTN